jgi:hypothetical protein
MRILKYVAMIFTIVTGGASVYTWLESFPKTHTAILVGIFVTSLVATAIFWRKGSGMQVDGDTLKVPEAGVYRVNFRKLFLVPPRVKITKQKGWEFTAIVTSVRADGFSVKIKKLISSRASNDPRGSELEWKACGQAKG